MYRINKEDIINMALEYGYMGFNTTIFKEEIIENYVAIFYENLKKHNIEWCGDILSNPDPIYNYVKDSTNEGYYIIDIEKLNSPHDGSLGIIPWELCCISQEDNALSALGLENKNGKLVQKKDKDVIKSYRK